MSVPNRIAPFLLKLGIPPDEHPELIACIESFVAAMALVLAANKGDAPNFITFALMADDERYELTVRKSNGLTPTEKIDALQARIDKALELTDRAHPWGCSRDEHAQVFAAARAALTGEDE